VATEKVRQKSKPKLCEACIANVMASFGFPAHLVHPETGQHMMFDVHSHAKCPVCGAMWWRTHRRMKLME
jgi:hypothetical protein